MEDQRKQVFYVHYRTAIVMNSQQLWLPAQVQVCQHFSTEIEENLSIHEPHMASREGKVGVF